MDKETKKVVTLVSRKLVIYDQCVKSKCKLESNASNRAMTVHKNKLENLRQQLYDKKISFKKFQDESLKTMTAIRNMEELKNKNECSLKECKKELLSIIDVFAKAIKKDCDKNKNKESCQTLKELAYVRNKIKNNEITNDFMQLMMKNMAKL
jgi:hypothetical protein